MKKEKILNLIGIVLGIAIIIAGISIMKNPAETWCNLLRRLLSIWRRFLYGTIRRNKGSRAQRRDYRKEY